MAGKSQNQKKIEETRKMLQETVKEVIGYAPKKVGADAMPPKKKK